MPSVAGLAWHLQHCQVSLKMCSPRAIVAESWGAVITGAGRSTGLSHTKWMYIRVASKSATSAANILPAILSARLIVYLLVPSKLNKKPGTAVRVDSQYITNIKTNPSRSFFGRRRAIWKETYPLLRLHELIGAGAIKAKDMTLIRQIQVGLAR